MVCGGRFKGASKVTIFIGIFILIATTLTLFSQSVIAPSINSTQADGLVGYGELNIQTPRYRTWNSSNDFSAEQTDAQAIGGDITWVVTRGNHERDEMIMGTIDKSNDVNIQIYDGIAGTWGNLQEVSIDVPNSAYRAFDIAVEDVSGDALIVYEDTSVADTTVKYRIWNGTTYSAEQSLTTGMASSAVNWVSLVSKRGADDIMLLVHDSEADGSGDLYAVPWNGTGFDTSKELLLSAATILSNVPHFSFAWEESSGAGLVAYGEGTDFVYRTYSPTAPYWSTEATITLGADDLKAARLCSDSTSDHIGIIMQDSGKDVNVRVWDGTAILGSPPTEDANVEAGGTNNVNVDCSWYNSSTALFGFINNADKTSMDYLTFTKTNTWSTASLTTASNTGSIAAGNIRGLRFTSHPTSSEVMAVAMDKAEDISAIRWDGSAFQTITASPIETSTEVLDAKQESAMFDWFRYDPVPNVTSINPSGTNFALSSTIDINATVTDNINVSAVLANITLPNGTIEQITLTDTDADDIYNNTFSTTDSTGTYTIRIIANDTSVHNNINSTETVTFTAGDVINPNVTIISPTSGQDFNQSDNVTIEANVTDEVNVSVVLANVTRPDGGIQQLTLSVQSNNVTYNGTFTNTSSVGTYTIRIIANDTTNNINSTQTVTFDVGDTTNPTVTNVTPTAGTNFALGASVNITANVTDNINVSVVLANVTLPNGTVEQLTLTDDNSDSVYNFTFTTTSANGQYNVTIISNDTSNNINSTEVTNFTVGDVIAPSITLNAPVNNSNTSSTSVTFNFTSTDETSITLNCSLLVDGSTDQTNTSVSNGTATIFTKTSLASGSHNWSVSCEDTAGTPNSNTSETRVFTVDLDNVTFVSLTTSPSAEDDLDPGVNVTAFANVTDNTTGIDTVIFQYKLSNETTYTNITMVVNSTGIYNATFNATQNGTYNLRLTANDTVGHSSTSNLVNISVQLDRTWTRSPSSFTAITANASVNVTIGNLTINNTGDYNLTFNITSDSSNTIYNETENFTLTAKEVKTIQVNDTSPSGGVKTVTLTITATPSGNPSSQTTTGNIVVAPGQPVLVATFTTPSGDTRTVTQGDTGVGFVATLENIGEGNASNVTFFYTLPSGWNLTFGNTNLSFDEILSGDSEESTIEVTIPSDATTGDFSVIVNATGVNATSTDLHTLGYILTDTVTVTVSSGAQLGSSSSSSSSGGGSSGGGSSGGGGGTSAAAGLVITPEQKDQLLQTEESFELVRGKDNSFEIKVTNPFEKRVLKNVTLSISGFLRQYLSVEPSIIDSIDFNKTKSFKVTITSPTYLEQDKRLLDLTIKGKITRKGFKPADFTERRTVTLIIHETSKEEAEENLDQTENLIQEMSDASLPTNRVNKLLAEAQFALQNKNYGRVKEMKEEIEKIKQIAFESNSLMLEVQRDIGFAEASGLSVEETKNILNLAKAAFEREDFETSLERAKEAQLTYSLETRGKINYVKLLVDYWYLVVLGSVLSVLATLFTYRRYLIVVVGRRLEDLIIEETNIFGLMTTLQVNTFDKGTVDTATYHKTMYEYEDRLNKINTEKSKLRSKRIGLLKKSHQLEELKKENKTLDNFIKQTQEDYFNKKKIDKSTYERRMKHYDTNQAEVEKHIAHLEEKIEKEKKLLEKKKTGKFRLFLKKLEFWRYK